MAALYMEMESLEQKCVRKDPTLYNASDELNRFRLGFWMFLEIKPTSLYNPHQNADFNKISALYKG